MIEQKNPSYRVTVISKETNKATIVEYPITCQFTVTRGVFAQSQKATISLYNIGTDKRNEIFQDQFTLDPKKYKYVFIEAGYNGVMPLIFSGRIMQAYSFRAGGQTDVITQIEAVATDIFDFQSSHTFAAGTTFKDALKTMAADMPNVLVGNTGTLEGQFQTPTTFDGSTIDCMNTLTGGHTFVDNGILNTLMDNEVIDVPVPVISQNTTLLETPMRRDANLEVKTLFLPDLIVGQLVEVDSSVSPNFNGQFKLVGFTHNCMIGKSQAGQRTTQLVLWIGPLLPGANIAITGGAAPVGFNKVKGEQVSPVNPMPITKKWIMPYNGRITSNFGARVAPKKGASTFHKGVDIGAPWGSKVQAPADGTVIYAGSNDPKGYGTYIVIDHGIINGKKVTSEYGHLSSYAVSYHQKVKQGQTIARSGNSGISTGPHLHFTVKENGTPVNPLKYVNSGSKFRGAGASGGW